MLRIFRGWLSRPRFARRMMNCSDTRVLRTRSELFRRALDLIPGGVNSPVRAMRAVGLDEPLFVGRGDGAYLEDVDGNRYVDWVMSWAPLTRCLRAPAPVSRRWVYRRAPAYRRRRRRTRSCASTTTSTQSHRLLPNTARVSQRSSSSPLRATWASFRPNPVFSKRCAAS